MTSERGFSPAPCDDRVRARSLNREEPGDPVTGSEKRDVTSAVTSLGSGRHTWHLAVGMGRGIPVLLGLCCLLAGALCPGVAQDQFPSGSAGGLSEAPLDLSVLPTSGEGVTAEPEEQTWTASLAESQSVTLSPGTGETGGFTERSVFGADDPVSASALPGSATVVGTDSSDEVISGSAETTTAQSRTFSEQDGTGREMTRSDNSAFTPTAMPTVTSTAIPSVTSTAIPSVTSTAIPSVTSTAIPTATPTAIPTATPTAPAREEQTAEATDIPSASPLAASPGLPAGQSQSAGEEPSVTTPSLELHTTWMAAITTNAFLRSTASPTIPTTQGTASTKTSPSEVQEQPSVLDVGEKDLPKFYSRGNSNSLFVMILSIFTIMVVLVVVVVVFHRYRQRNNRTEFRRLQDLPMDDMMEDTPLSLYSY